LFDFTPARHDELTLSKGDKLVIERRTSANWWQGMHITSGRRGLFPTNYIKVVQENEINEKQHETKKVEIKVETKNTTKKKSIKTTV
jgi:hypothetical protein